VVVVVVVMVVVVVVVVVYKTDSIHTNVDTYPSLYVTNCLQQINA
jgi:hypothetical protein